MHAKCAFLIFFQLLLVFPLPIRSAYECKNDARIDVEEGRQFHVTCDMPGAHKLEWRRLTTDGKVEETIGSCTFPVSGHPKCHLRDLNEQGHKYEVTSEGRPTSMLTIMVNPLSSIAGRLECVGTVGGGSSDGIGEAVPVTHRTGTVQEIKRSCQIDVYYPENKVKNCRLQWNTENSDGWTVSGSCDVDRIESSPPGQYRCKWRHAIGDRIVCENDSVILEDGFTMRCGFDKYKCHDLDSSNWNRAFFNLQILLPGGKRWLQAKEIRVDKPSRGPELVHCPGHWNESDNVHCRCRPSSTKPGVPGAVVTWKKELKEVHNILSIRNVGRELNGHTYRCSQHWGSWDDVDVKTVDYTVHVYYRPFIYFANPEYAYGMLTVTENQPVTIECRADEGNPKSFVAGSLRLVCDRVNSSADTSSQNSVWKITLTFTPELSTHNEAICTCSVTPKMTDNGIHEDKIAKLKLLVKKASGPQTTDTPDKTTAPSTTKSITPTTTTTTTTTTTAATSPNGTKDNIVDDDDDDDDSGTIIIIIASASAGGLAIVIIVVVVVVKRRDPLYARPSRNREQEHVYCEMGNVSPNQEQSNRNDEAGLDNRNRHQENAARVVRRNEASFPVRTVRQVDEGGYEVPVNRRHTDDQRLEDDPVCAGPAQDGEDGDDDEPYLELIDEPRASNDETGLYNRNRNVHDVTRDETSSPAHAMPLRRTDENGYEIMQPGGFVFKKGGQNV